MIESQDDAPLEPELLEAARGWREPPPPPRDEMWREIGRRRAARRLAHPDWRKLGFPLGIAALVALGVALGRMSVPPIVPKPVQHVAVVPTQPTADNGSITVVANEHLSRTEAFLTEFRAEARGSAVPDHFRATSRDLLLETRLLMDAPTLQDARVRGLLQDLEVILVQIAQLHNDNRPDDVDIITNGLKQRDVLPRLRTAIPAALDPAHSRKES